jgi:hypothetical protein
MEPSGGLQDVATRAKVQVVGVAEYDLGLNLFQLPGFNGFHRSLGPDRHEYRGTNLSVRQPHPAGARMTIGMFKREFQVK